MIELEVEPWTVDDAAELYEIARWGNGYFGINAAGHVCVLPNKDATKPIDLKQLVDRLQLRGIDLPILIRFAGILQHRLGEIHDAFNNAIAEHKYQGQLLLRLSDQGESAAAGGRRGGRIRPAVAVRARSRQQAGAAGRRGDGRRTTRRSSATASRTPNSSRWRCWPKRSAGSIIPVVEKYTELGLILEVRGKDRRAAEHRHARQAGGPRQRALAIVGRLPFEIRPDRDRNSPRPGRTESPRHGRLLQALALPSGQPDHQHPPDQSGAERSGPDLHRAGQPRRRPGISRRRRRLGRRLRRLANQFRIERQLHAAGIRQRRRVSRPNASATTPACKHPTIISESGRAVVAYHSVLVFGVLGRIGAWAKTASRCSWPRTSSSR